MSRNALAITTLIRQINKLAPHRSKIHDGTIGDAAHKALGNKSDHNPWFNNIVTAVDATDNPSGGFDGTHFTNALVRSNDNRIKYIIDNGMIINLSPGHPHEGVWRKYTGLNSHSKHTHLSVLPDVCDDARDWDLWIFHLLLFGNWNGEVGLLQRRLNSFGANITVDDKFGPQTDNAVRSFQKFRGLAQDGIVGPATRKPLGM